MSFFFFFLFFSFFGEFFSPLLLSVSLLHFPSLFEKPKKTKKAAYSSLTSVNDASRALASTPPAGRMLVVRSGVGAGAGATSAMVACFFLFFLSREERRGAAVRVFLLSLFFGERWRGEEK